MSETAKLADVVLPAAAGFAETNGVFTNSERRVQRVRKAVEPPGNAKADWEIAQLIANTLGAGWNYENSEQIWNEVRRTSPPHRGISYERIEEVGLQWPCPSEDHPGTPFLHEGEFPTPDGKATFLPVPWRPSAEATDDEYPLLLTTGRRLSTYHTGTQTRRAEAFGTLGINFRAVKPA